MDSETRRKKEKLLATHKQNLANLEEQIASHGPPTPLGLINSRESEKQSIANLTGSTRSDLPARARYVNMWTYEPGERLDLSLDILDTCYRIDLTSFFSQTTHTVRSPNVSEWEDILSQLRQFANDCRHDPTIVGIIHSTAPIGVAFGRTFAAAPKTIWVNQGQKGRIDWWNSDAEAGGVDIPIARPGEISNGTDTVIEVCAIHHQRNNVRQQVTEAIDRLSISVKERISIGFEDIPNGVQGPGHATAIANIVGQAVRNVQGGNEVHLFLAIPVALSVFIGLELNACPQVRCYEHIKNDHTRNQHYYVPACLLR